MTLTPAQIDALPGYTAGQMVKVLTNALVTVASDPTASVNIGNRSYTQQNMREIADAIAFWKRIDADEQAVAAAATAGCPRARFQSPT